jgi:small GTP-binding protein
MTSAEAEARRLLSSVAAELERVAEEGGEPTIAAGARELLGKLEGNRFHLVVVGQFKRGKTSLLNALVGEAVLPVAVLPLTSAVTILRYGDRPGATVHFENGKQIAVGLDQIAEYATEAENPKNVKRVGRVEVAYPSASLRDGVVLIDTPGIASVYAHNTQATHGFLPRIDAAVFVTSPEPPLTSAERDFLEDLQKQVAKIFVVMNKADLAGAEELAEVVGFAERSLPEGLAGAPILTVSAKQGLEAKAKGDPALLERSGLAALESKLERFLRDEKSAVLLRSAARRLVGLMAEYGMYLALRVRAVKMPVEELEAKIAIFDEQLKLANQQQEDNDLLLNGVVARLASGFEEEAMQFAASQAGSMSAAVLQFMEQSRSLPRRKLAAAADRFIAERVREAFEAWRGEFERRAGTGFREATIRFQRNVNEVGRKVRETAGGLFQVGIADFEMQEDLVWVEPSGYYTDPLLEWGLGGAPLLLPGALYYRHLRRRASKRVREELERNAYRAAYDFKRRLNESASRFRRELNEKLNGTTERIRAAIETALAKHRPGAVEADAFARKAEASLEAIERMRGSVVGALEPAGLGRLEV